jgi:hypothetical protein
VKPSRLEGPTKRFVQASGVTEVTQRGGQTTALLEREVGHGWEGGKAAASGAAWQGTAPFVHVSAAGGRAPVDGNGDRFVAPLADATLETAPAIRPKPPFDDVTLLRAVSDHGTNLGIEPS